MNIIEPDVIDLVVVANLDIDGDTATGIGIV